MSLYTTVLREPAPFWTFIFLWISLPFVKVQKWELGIEQEPLFSRPHPLTPSALSTIPPSTQVL